MNRFILLGFFWQMLQWRSNLIWFSTGLCKVWTFYFLNWRKTVVQQSSGVFQHHYTWYEWGEDVMQQRSTGQIWAQGHCGGDTASVLGAHTLLGELPRRSEFFLKFDVNYPDGNLQGYAVIMLTKLTTDRQTNSWQNAQNCLCGISDSVSPGSQFARMTHKYWLTRWKHYQPMLTQLVNTLLRLQSLSLHLFSVL